MPVLPVFLSSKGFAETQIGLIMGTAAVAAVFVRPWVGIQVDTRGSRPILMWGQVLLLISICGLLWADGLVPFVALRFIYGIAIAFYGTGAVTFASSIGTGAKNANAIALYTLMTMLGLGTSMSMAQFFFDNFGFAVLVYTATAMIVIAYSVMQFRASIIIDCRKCRQECFLLGGIEEQGCSGHICRVIRKQFRIRCIVYVYPPCCHIQ